MPTTKNNFRIWKFNPKILNSEDYKLNNKIAKVSSKKAFQRYAKNILIYLFITWKNFLS